MKSSATIIGGNDDLLTEILILLPVKSLIKFKLVSKNWRSLISAPAFTTLHFRRRRREHQDSFILASANSQFLVCDSTVSRLIPFFFPFGSVVILQSCNGLLLLKCAKTPTGRKRYCVFNPTTMESRVLPSTKYCAGIYLIFDPSVSPYYKVMGCRSCRDGWGIVFGVYDSQTREWRAGGELVGTVGTSSFRFGIYSNGGIYFVRYTGSSFRLIPDGVIQGIPDPPQISFTQSNKNYAVESNGVLHFITLRLKQGRIVSHVFEMKEDIQAWSLKYRGISLEANFSKLGGTIELIGMVRGDKDEESSMLFHVPGRILVYRFGDEVFEELVDFTMEDYFKEGRLQFEFRNAFLFIASFAPV